MGTRNLTMVISGGKTRIAQYGQWDGYPEGQGVNIYDFLKEADLDEFRKKLETTAFVDEDKEREIDNYLKKLGSENGWMNMEQAEKYKKKYPLLSRDVCGDILKLLYRSKNSINWVNNSESFAADSLFCEWAYVVDMDNMKFEVYKGYNTEPLQEGERFYYLTEERDNPDYYPVKFLTSFDLTNLPSSSDAFIQLCKEKIPQVQD